MQISAIIPTYNYGKYVGRAIESVLRQSRPVDELIVVDDGSTDDTRQRLAVYGDRIRYIYQPNRGLPGARNTGMAQARYPWVAFLDSDDWWYPDKIARQVAVAEADAGIDFVYTGLCMVEPDGKKQERRAVAPETLWPRLRYVNMITPSTVLARRALLQQAGGFDETLKTCEDWEIWVRLGEGVRYGAVAEPMIGYQITPGSLSSKIELEIRTTEEIAQKTLLAGLTGWSREIWRRRITSAQLFRVSVVIRTVDASRSRHYVLRSILRWPSPVFMPDRWKTMVLEGLKFFGLKLAIGTAVQQTASQPKAAAAEPVSPDLVPQPGGLDGRSNVAADLELARTAELIGRAAHGREERLFTAGLVQFDAQVQHLANPLPGIVGKDLSVDLEQI